MLSGISSLISSINNLVLEPAPSAPIVHFDESQLSEEAERVRALYIICVPKKDVPYKFSRKACPSLKLSYSYFVIPCGATAADCVFRKMHCKAFTRSDGALVPADQSLCRDQKPGYIDGGANKTIYRILNSAKRRDWTIASLKKWPETTKAANEVCTHLPSLRQHPEIHKGYYLRYKNPSGAERQVFLSEYMNEGSIVDGLESGRLICCQNAENGDIALETARGLEKFHQLNLVHCDVKIENVFLHQEEKTGVTPGVHREVRLGDYEFTHKVTPELEISWGSSGAIDPLVFAQRLNGGNALKGDIFSLGVLYFQLFYDPNGRPYDEALTRAKQGIVPEKDEKLKKFFKELEGDDPLKCLVRQMCDFSPEKRPDIAEVIARLEKIFRQ